jgi:hypothetical protein
MTPNSSRFLLAATLLLGLGSLAGCSSTPTLACDGLFPIAIRLRAKDGQSGAPIGNPIVEATIVEAPTFVVSTYRPPDDSTLTLLYGEGGTYEVRVKKVGYADVTQRVTVVQGDDRCGDLVAAIDLTVSLSRVP